MGPRRAEFEAIGITGYPESHHLISDEETIRAMFAKAPMATHIVSQLCFDASTIAGWIAEVRRRGTDLPIWIGVPGNVPYARLVRVSMKIGLGESARFLSHHRNWMSRLIDAPFTPDRLVRELTPCATDPAARVAGFHLYTFNEVARTERWRRAALATGRPSPKPFHQSDSTSSVNVGRPRISDEPFAFTPSSSITVQNGQATASVSAPVSAASRARSSLISPGRAPPSTCGRRRRRSRTCACRCAPSRPADRRRRPARAGPRARRCAGPGSTSRGR